MKRALFALWMLIALLLPLRGALAVAMPCAWAPPAPAAAMVQDASDEAPCPMHAAQAEPTTPSGSCGLCAAACSAALPSLPAAFPLGALPAARAGFPALALPPYAFQRDGPERPPRFG